jgi:hypothetical protein
VRRLTRVERYDAPKRAAGLGAFCRALLEQGRDPIVAAFEARSLTRAQIESLAADAEAAAEAGRIVMQAAEATSRETAAAGAQRRNGQQVRRMVRKAVEGIPELEKKYAECWSGHTARLEHQGFSPTAKPSRRTWRGVPPRKSPSHETRRPPLAPWRPPPARRAHSAERAGVRADPPGGRR